MLKYFFCHIPSIFSLWNLYFVKPFVVGLQVPKMLLIFSIFFLQISFCWLILFTEPFQSHIHFQIKLLQGIFISDFLFQFYYSHLLIFNAFLRYLHTIKFTFIMNVQIYEAITTVQFRASSLSTISMIPTIPPILIAAPAPGNSLSRFYLSCLFGLFYLNGIQCLFI